ncbi:hypothetical protein DFH08DRAFT_900911 [Mycena albidolilacea]|uniref:Uncharacterized protein n=1 Tax=Mycena albidolilacea TaxID=1033008 RepID=A0AAD6Z5T4_9AGAR|nr:hypothetical protein DFH08DRAFT_900911 [Mycena albidolilacea]
MLVLVGLGTVIVYAESTQRLCRLKEAIDVSDKLRTEAKKSCERRSDKVKLSGLERQLFQVKTAASKIQVQLSETRTTWRGFVRYLQCMWDIRREIFQRAGELREIQSSTRRTFETIETEHQRQLRRRRRGEQVLGGVLYNASVLSRRNETYLRG